MVTTFHVTMAKVQTIICASFLVDPCVCADATVLGVPPDIEPIQKVTVKRNATKRNGKHIPMHRLVIRPTEPHNICTSSIVVFFENIWFGIHVTSGKKSHKGHPKIREKCLRLPQRLLSSH